MRKNPVGILDFFLVAGWLWILPALIIILIFLIWFLFLWDWIRIQFKLFFSFFFFLSLSFLKDLFEMAVKRWGHLYRQVEGKWIRLTSGWYPVDIRSEIGREFCCVWQLMRCKAFLITSVIRFKHRIQLLINRLFLSSSPSFFFIFIFVTAAAAAADVVVVAGYLSKYQLESLVIDWFISKRFISIILRCWCRYTVKWMASAGFVDDQFLHRWNSSIDPPLLESFPMPCDTCSLAGQPASLWSISAYYISVVWRFFSVWSVPDYPVIKVPAAVIPIYDRMLNTKSMEPGMNMATFHWSNRPIRVRGDRCLFAVKSNVLIVIHSDCHIFISFRRLEAIRWRLNRIRNNASIYLMKQRRPIYCSWLLLHSVVVVAVVAVAVWVGWSAVVWFLMFLLVETVYPVAA